MTDFDITYFQVWGRAFKTIGRFFWSANRTSEFDEGMIIRSDAIVSLLKVIIHANPFSGESYFILRKNGDSAGGVLNPALEEHRFTIAAGQTGVFETGLSFNYSKDDLICFQHFNSQAGLTVDFEMSCRIQYLIPP